MDEIQIKDVQIRAHQDVMDEFMQGLHESEHQFFDKTAPWDEIRESYMQHIIAMQEEYEGTCLIAYVNGQPAGFIFGYLEEEDESRIETYTGKILYVSDGYVAPAFRRLGIYKKMNSQLEQKYIHMGVKRMTRFTLVNNEPMKAFLSRSSYQPTRILFEKWL
jgi:GNAT superfamily N-acetyltransferase